MHIFFVCVLWRLFVAHHVDAYWFAFMSLCKCVFACTYTRVLADYLAGMPRGSMLLHTKQ